MWHTVNPTVDSFWGHGIDGNTMPLQGIVFGSSPNSSTKNNVHTVEGQYMSENINKEKSKQLGMPTGTATNRLRKMILFHLLKKHNENFCFQCTKEIKTIEELSIEHKKPWLHEDVDLFWDMNNIAFSHLSCNCSAARIRIGVLIHGTENGYDTYGCRCDACTNARRLYRQEDRKRHKLKMLL